MGNTMEAEHSSEIPTCDFCLLPSAYYVTYNDRLTNEKVVENHCEIHAPIHEDALDYFRFGKNVVRRPYRRPLRTPH